MSTQTEVPMDDPMRKAWEDYTQTDEYRNTLRWATEPCRTSDTTFECRHTEGSLWAAFIKGYESALNTSKGEG